jgi:hypothetical protein
MNVAGSARYQGAPLHREGALDDLSLASISGISSHHVATRDNSQETFTQPFLSKLRASPAMLWRLYPETQVRRNVKLQRSCTSHFATASKMLHTLIGEYTSNSVSPSQQRRKFARLALQIEKTDTHAVFNVKVD